MAQNLGKIAQIIGPVIDVTFDQEGSKLPEIYDALEIERAGMDNLVLECEQHIGENTIRTIAMDSTDGLSRGMSVTATGKAISMPIGNVIKGRLLNVIGEAIDGIGPIAKDRVYEIHNKPPLYEEIGRAHV